MENLAIGVQSWRREAWIGEFYPEGMPEDWQLDFYSNQFYSVLVPEIEWLTWTEDETEEIVEGLEGEDFSFYFAVSHSLDEKAWQQLVKLSVELKGFFKGVLSFDADFKMPMALNGVSLTYCVETPKFQALVDFTPDWVWQWAGRTMYGHPVGWVEQLPKEGKAQTEMLRSFMASTPKDMIGLSFFVADKELEGNALVQLKTIAELLGF